VLLLSSSLLLCRDVVAICTVGSSLGTELKGSCEGIELYQRCHTTEEEGNSALLCSHWCLL